MMTMTDVQILNREYHRNGISGVGFHAIEFTYVEDGLRRRAVATVSAEDVEAFKNGEAHDPQTRVLMFNRNTAKIDVNETMRGDNFHEFFMELLSKK